jgi:cytochrome c556
MVYDGAAVKAGDLVLRIADRSTMWADLQVYEQDLPFIRIGQRASVTLTSQMGKAVEGEVSFIHPHLDMMTRSAKVRVVLPNVAHQLHEGMYVSATLDATIAQNALLVPREAIIDTGVRQIAFVSVGPGSFEPREVKVGSGDNAGSIEVLSGLSAGEQVVTSGQFLIDSESRTQEAVQKILQGKVATGSPANAPAAAASSPQSEAIQQRLDAMFDEYLKVSAALGALQTKDEPLEAEPLLKAADALVEIASDPAAKARSNALRDAAARLRGGSLAEQRKAFADVSAAVVAIADATPPSAAVQTLVVFHCPMARGDAGADWIQGSNEIANPFFGTTMKACGSKVRTINPRSAQKRGSAAS